MMNKTSRGINNIITCFEDLLKYFVNEMED